MITAWNSRENATSNLALNVKQSSIADAQKKLGMKEGFDVGLEMSGNASAFRDMLHNMAHGGRIAILGIPSDEIAIDWREVIFNMLTLSGIYGRQMYESWYKMTVLLQSGLDIRPVITHRFSYRDFEEAFQRHALRQQRQGHSELGRITRRLALSVAEIHECRIADQRDDRQGDHDDLGLMQTFHHPVPLSAENITQRDENRGPAEGSRISEEREIRKLNSDTPATYPVKCRTPGMK